MSAHYWSTHTVLIQTDKAAVYGETTVVHVTMNRTRALLGQEQHLGTCGSRWNFRYEEKSFAQSTAWHDVSLLGRPDLELLWKVTCVEVCALRTPTPYWQSVYPLQTLSIQPPVLCCLFAWTYANGLNDYIQMLCASTHSGSWFGLAEKHGGSFAWNIL